APANIAFIKYWGKADPPARLDSAKRAGEAGDALRLPLNSSISMNLSGCTTTTTIEFSKDLDCDDVTFLDALTTITRPRYCCQSSGRRHSDSQEERIAHHLDRLRQRAGIKLYAKVVTKNSFPKGAGVASSASGFAALTVAAASALGLLLSEKELSIFSRLGSGSACRSIPDGFVEWRKGNNSLTSYARSLYPADYWDLRDILLIVEASQKKTGSTEGMNKARTSPFFARRLRDIPDRIKDVKRAIADKDLKRLGAAMEEDCIIIHAVAMTQKPPIFYWDGKTLDIIRSVYEWRSQGLPVYFTIDAGPNVHLICEAKDEKMVVEKAEEFAEVERIIINKPAQGARLTDEHLF
ncbi:diphosphomevalonate decarboxylase, partial [Candidatus Gottesmanbacteria bacterium]|nr:diphosphomevalonate decarboxylase [Candidatus Gottesmanbacteria bacterium]